MKSYSPDKRVLYEALVNKDSRYEGQYYVGVKTTGIFCRLTCKARTPKLENVEFYQSRQEAMSMGFRPCKLCRPMEPAGQEPEWLQPLLDEIRDNPNGKLTDWELRKRGVDPNRVRRWFKTNYGMTFHAYLRTLKISDAIGRIQYGDKVIEAAFESGYDSLSGFTDIFKKMTGHSPVQSRHTTALKVSRILTPIGPMLAGAVDDGICLLEFTDRRMLETQLKRLRKQLKADIIPGTSGHFETLNREIGEYFEGTRKDFEVPLALTGTPFQKSVWKLLMEIPYGEIRSYKRQAELLGNPQAVRAVGKANGDNKISIIVPCHRVLGENGELTGYGGGLARKQYLLDLERKHSGV